MSATPSAVTWKPASDGVLLVTLSNGPANAVGPPIIDGLAAMLDHAAANQIKVVVIESALERFFAAGADIKHMGDVNATTFTAYGDSMRAVFDRLAGSELISIAAIEGLALGGGLELTMACTMRVGGADAKVGLPEVKLGLIPGAGGTQRLPRLVGRGRALDMMITARQVPADEASAIGLLDRLVPAGQATETALELAAEIARHSLPAQLAVVRCADAAFDLPLTEGFQFEIDQEQELFEKGEAQEGIAAFIGKRAPTFA
ncbi:enoyl-CoA hydratase [Nocardioides seonyuensis]|uniref:enoyl-CoA hydratase n=1 Tax=Nocardioides seonyuensis TaxID=2518371 RepID=A0A4P7IF91_9ACTN|nr:enoyl-CoA hydratase-related protein [Nocardioides seonyuensis]QBX55934.1 enoyl-CoA hydratase [Nocardioides seonyuensis]